ncbi:hypothetical protein AKJ65_00560 [candidate division MSBL1 archaeon SCGC-AAA259E19]|uniref:Uncharacterized protein n=1 Tax=candidate division MSBL1 archaeon SCGC-AAA259E19 TaxID=1698264 RepID=A0A133UNP8_9EURY|nr:hypothetical protein AKJ65_00560 [candidate division MSBL1 archaeon SCGC-AAA259E19]
MTFNRLPPISEKLTLRYIHQKTEEIIGEKNFDFDSSEFEDNLDFATEYWTGKKDPVPVGKNKGGWPRPSRTSAGC